MPGRPEQPLPMVEAVPEDQASALALLRRPQVEGDRVPEDRRRGLEGGMMGRLGLNPDLARRALTEASVVWVTPGNGYVCLECGGACCTPAEAAAGIVSWTSSRSGDCCIVHGLVPDGVSEVTLVTTTGASADVPVRDSVFGAVLDGPLLQSVRLKGAAGPVVLGPWGG